MISSALKKSKNKTKNDFCLNKRYFWLKIYADLGVLLEKISNKKNISLYQITIYCIIEIRIQSLSSSGSYLTIFESLHVI